MSEVAINVGVVDGDTRDHYLVVADRVDPPVRRVVGDLRQDAGRWLLTPRWPLDFDAYPLDDALLEDVLRRA